MENAGQCMHQPQIPKKIYFSYFFSIAQNIHWLQHSKGILLTFTSHSFRRCRTWNGECPSALIVIIYSDSNNALLPGDNDECTVLTAEAKTRLYIFRDRYAISPTKSSKNILCPSHLSAKPSTKKKNPYKTLSTSTPPHLLSRILPTMPHYHQLITVITVFFHILYSLIVNE